MEFKDIVENMHGRLEIWKVYENGKTEKVFSNPNAITYRGKLIMSRILAGGLSPNSTPTYAAGLTRDYRYGSNNSDQLRVTGMAFGNGGHLIYDSVSSVTDVLPKTGMQLNAGSIASNPAKPAMPKIGVSSWGYASQVDRDIPGVTYQKVENGNIPWDGTANIDDNDVGVLQPNTTLYSETFRIPLDDAISVSLDGYAAPSQNEVQFKATIPQSRLNYTGSWGFSTQQANYVSEAGLIVGYRPDLSAINANTGQIYSSDGGEPSGANDEAANWDSKDGSGTYVSANATGLDKYRSLPPTIVNGVDTWATTADNRWNTIARKNFPAIPKSSAFGILFIWTIGW